jgi:hypothetical protein
MTFTHSLFYPLYKIVGDGLGLAQFSLSHGETEHGVHPDIFCNQTVQYAITL